MGVRGFGLGLLISVAVLAAMPAPAGAQTVAPRPPDTTLEARVTEVLEEHADDGLQVYQRLQMVITAGPGIGERVVVENGDISVVNIQRYQVGDRLVLTGTTDAQGRPVFFITDYVRRDSLLVLLILFAVLTVAVGRVYGATSLIGLAISFVVVFRFVLPQILAGRDPIVTAILGSLVIVPVSFYLSHGWNRKTSIAIAGTLIALIATGILAGVFVGQANLTGLAGEEAAFLDVANVADIDMQGLLLAGIIIASLGVLDDITVSQAAIVEQLKEARQSLSRSELYRRAMRVGQDHIASAVNTLVLVYAGAQLPLLLLFVTSGRPVAEIVNSEIVAQEIVRTLVGCVGLILAVPVTTLIAAVVMDRPPGAAVPVPNSNVDVDFDPD